jgi:hypothetical protein
MLDALYMKKKANKFLLKILPFFLGKSYYTGMQYDYLEHIKNMS